MEFTKEELQAIAQLIGRADIKGTESFAVAQLLGKINQMLQPKPKEPKEIKK